MKQCPKCSVLIKNSTHFHRHVKRCGTTEHRVQCPFCPKTYSRNDDLKKHIKKKHPQPTPTPAPGFTFNHTTHCGTAATRYQCLQCPLTFSRKDSLQRHKQRQHSKNPPRFYCPVVRDSHVNKAGIFIWSPCAARINLATTVGFVLHPLQDPPTCRNTCDFSTDESVETRT